MVSVFGFDRCGGVVAVLERSAVVDPAGDSIRRRTDFAGIFPNRQALVRLVGAILGEHDEWTEMRRYIGLDAQAHEGSSSLSMVGPFCR